MEILSGGKSGGGEGGGEGKKTALLFAVIFSGSVDIQRTETNN